MQSYIQSNYALDHAKTPVEQPSDDHLGPISDKPFNRRVAEYIYDKHKDNIVGHTRSFRSALTPSSDSLFSTSQEKKFLELSKGILMRACTKPVGRTLPQLVSVDVHLPYFYMAVDAAQALFQETVRAYLNHQTETGETKSVWKTFVNESRNCLNGLLYWKL